MSVCVCVCVSPVLVALYMFSMGNAEPRPYSSTLDRAGISWVVVTSTLTQLGLGRRTRTGLRWILSRLLGHGIDRWVFAFIIMIIINIFTSHHLFMFISDVSTHCK